MKHFYIAFSILLMLLLPLCCHSEPLVDALIRAAYLGEVDMVETLISSGVDVNAEGKSLHFGSANSTAFFDACSNFTGQSTKHKAVLKKLVSAGANVTYKHKKVGTSLFYACKSRKIKVVEFLIKLGQRFRIK